MIDQMGVEVSCPFPPKRIVSLVPSQTELLADLGLTTEVVGITKFCVHPAAWRKTKAIIGGTKNFQFDVIDALKPDLIIGNKEENYSEGIHTLKEKYPVWMSDIVSFADAFEMIQSIGELTHCTVASHAIIESIRSAFETLKKFSGQSVLYMIWRKPWMAAGTDTFIHTILETLGLKNIVTIPRYPELSMSLLAELKPDYVFLSSEPYPFAEKHKQELQQIIPSSKIRLVDGEMFSWYGSRLIKAPAYFNTLNTPV